MPKTPIKFIRVFILLVIGLVVALWMHLNWDYNVGLTFTLIGIATLVIYKYAYDAITGGK